jgi:hypothetical protein
MNKLLTSALLGLGSVFSTQAQVLLFDIDVNRNFLLTSPTASQYINGSTRLYFQDGQILLSPCPHPSPTIIPPITNPPICPLGTTAFLIEGDIDGDGVADDRSFWSVSDIILNSFMEPFLPNSVTLAAAPPSTLSRPSGDFTDGSIASFYNVLTPVVKRYDLASYEYLRTYDIISNPNAYQAHAQQWVSGIYIYNVPIKNEPNRFQPLRMTLTAMVEANGFRRGLKGFGLKTKMWSNGALEIDPRLITTLTWEGNTRNNTYSSDVIEFSMADSTGRILYPVPDIAYRLDSPFLTSLTMIPYSFTKGQVGTSSMRFRRFLNTNAVTTDTSTRSWTWATRFIDSYRAHEQYEFRVTNTAAIPGIKVAGAPTTLRQPNSDYDGDGISNILEFAFSQDDGDDTNNTLEWTSYHNDPALQPTPVQLAALGFVAPTTPAPVFLDTLNNGVNTDPYVFTKRRNVGASITYGYEVNYNTASTKPKWVRLKGPAPGGTAVISDRTAAKLLGIPNFTWTITDTFDTIAPAPETTGTTTIQASHALPPTVRVRSTATVTSGY